MIKVWDPLVRLFHWSLVLSFAIAWVSSEGFDGLHIWSGYAAGALIAFRLFWGLIGPRYARFTQFVKGPGTTIGYIKTMVAGQEKRYVGHNPAGGAMVIALIILLGLSVWTGWLTTLPQYKNAVLVSDAHGFATSVLMLLVVVHVAGVIWASIRHKENLAKAMVNGRKSPAEPGDVA